MKCVENIRCRGNELRLGFYAAEGTAYVETQCLYYAEMKIIIVCVELKKGRHEEEVSLEKKEDERERTGRKEGERDRGMKTFS